MAGKEKQREEVTRGEGEEKKKRTSSFVVERKGRKCFSRQILGGKEGVHFQAR